MNSKFRSSIIGKRFGNLIVESFNHVKKDSENKNRSYFLCKCDCGESKVVSMSYLRDSGRASCGCLRKRNSNPNWRGYGDISMDKFRSYKDGAINRNLEFSLEIEKIWDLFTDQKGKCKLSGLTISFLDNTASLDRIDSSIGYIEGNVQWVHKDVNKIKNDLKEPYFFELCAAIDSKNNLKIEDSEIVELESEKIYFANFKDHSEDIPEFVKALKDNNIKCLITVGEVIFEDIVDTVRQLPVEYQKKIHEDWAARQKRLEINFED